MHFATTREWVQTTACSTRECSLNLRSAFGHPTRGVERPGWAPSGPSATVWNDCFWIAFPALLYRFRRLKHDVLQWLDPCFAEEADLRRFVAPELGQAHTHEADACLDRVEASDQG